MNVLKIILTACLSLTVLSSCQKAFDVNSVHFSKDGGTEVIASSSYVLSISNNNGDYGEGYEDFEQNIIHAEKDWLKAELDVNTGYITVSARKNDTGKRRKLYLNGMHGNIASTIPVIQDK